MVTVLHDSDCAVHNAPALPVGPCDCGAEAFQKSPEYEVGVKLGTAEYYRDKYKAALERIARENPHHESQGHSWSDFGNSDDMATDAANVSCGLIGDIAREALGQKE